MGRPSKPRFRADRRAWVCTVGGVYHTLATGRENRAEAFRAFHRLMAAPGEPAGGGDGLPLVALVEAFLDHCEKNLAHLTYVFYRKHAVSFADHLGKAFPAAEVRPRHVDAWLGSRAWNPTTRAGAVTAVKRLFRWAKKQRLLASNELADLEKPTPLPREAVMTAGQVGDVFAAVRDAPFRDLLTFLHEVGCRPSEAARVEAGMVDPEAGTVVMASKTTRRTRRPRVIYLTPAAAAVVARLAAEHPEGPLFRNTKGRPWTRNATACRFARLRKKLGMGAEATAESYRHVFITDALDRRVPIATVAELAGHSSTAMIARHYSHLRDRKDHLSEAARKVRPGD